MTRNELRHSDQIDPNQWQLGLKGLFVFSSGEVIRSPPQGCFAGTAPFPSPRRARPTSPWCPSPGAFLCGPVAARRKWSRPCPSGPAPFAVSGRSGSGAGSEGASQAKSPFVSQGEGALFGIVVRKKIGTGTVHPPGRLSPVPIHARQPVEGMLAAVLSRPSISAG
jgi:hypothetical protein